MGHVSQAVVFGEDDRLELLEADPPWRTIGQASVAAIARGNRLLHRWRFCDGVHFPDSPSLRETSELCEDQAFGEQTPLVSCTATLIDHDLLLTAAHCLPDGDACRDARFVFGVFLDGAPMPDVAIQDVYACAEIVAEVDRRDLVVARTDRPVEGRAFVPLANEAPAIGDPLHVIGFAEGLPMKVSTNCSVQGLSARGHLNNCEGAPGSSGASVLNASGEILGVVRTGPPSLRRREGADCRERVTLADDGRVPSVPAAAPQLSAVDSAAGVVEALCATGEPSGLCGTTAVCGDERCTGTETSENCTADCVTPRCGDGVCNPGEAHRCEDCVELPWEDVCEMADSGTSDVDAGWVADGGVLADASAEFDARGSDAGDESAPRTVSSACSAGGAPAAFFALTLFFARRRRREGGCSHASIAWRG